MSLPLFEHGATRLNEIVRPGMLCAFDFDGVLAPVVRDPERADIPPAVLRRLMTLSEMSRVAVVSARCVDDIAMRVDFMPEFVIGNHGLEGLPEFDSESARYHALCVEWERQLQECTAMAPGLRIENRGCSLAVHCRMGGCDGELEQRLMKLFASLQPTPRIVAGKYALNLLPADVPGKGELLMRLRTACAAPAALYVCDDVSDDEVLKLRAQDWLTVRVDGPGEAEFCLAHRLDMVQLLDMLIQKLEQA